MQHFWTCCTCRPVICSRPNLEEPSKFAKFPGHLMLDHVRRKQKKEGELVNIYYIHCHKLFYSLLWLKWWLSFKSCLLCHSSIREMWRQHVTLPRTIQLNGIWPWNGVLSRRGQNCSGKHYMRFFTFHLLVIRSWLHQLAKHSELSLVSDLNNATLLNTIDCRTWHKQTLI